MEITPTAGDDQFERRACLMEAWRVYRTSGGRNFVGGRSIYLWLLAGLARGRSSTMSKMHHSSEPSRRGAPPCFTLFAMTALSRSKLFYSILAALAATAIWLSSGRLEQVQGLSTREVIQIRHAVRKEVWKEVFPTWSVSLYRLKYLPSAVSDAWRAEITVVGLQPDGHVQADVTYPGHRATLYGLDNQSNRWVVAGRPLNIGW